MKANVKKTKGRKKGFVTIYMVFTMLTLIPVAGLAIDFSVLYSVKAKLQQALDAGAIGAGNMVQRSTDVTDPVQNANLRDAVTRFFNSNLTPIPWNAVQTNFSTTVSQDINKVRTIYVTATYDVPMLFMRVLHINKSTVGGDATAKIRFVNMMVVVDRSGSVTRTGSGGTTNDVIIKNDLNDFIGDPATSIFVDGRDVVGLISFGGNYNNDYLPSVNFQTSGGGITNAINAMVFDSANSTNTGEGLYQAWYQLNQLNQVGALNVIVLITDGRPSGLTGTFDAGAAPFCTDKTPKAGVITSSVANPFPPPSSRTTSGVLKVTPAPTCGGPTMPGSGCEPWTFVSNSTGCKYKIDTTPTVSKASEFSLDILTIPAKIGPITNISGGNVPYQTQFDSQATGYTTGVWPTTGRGSATNDAVSVRGAAYNYADNVATAIRKDTTYKPVIYAIGLNFDTAAYPTEEPLDPDWLARVANDPNYRRKDPGYVGMTVFQNNQTIGKYYDVTYAGLGAALRDITSQILRLSFN